MGVPSGTKDMCPVDARNEGDQIVPDVHSRDVCGESVVPAGTIEFRRIVFPPLKRWAIVSRPWRDESQVLH